MSLTKERRCSRICPRRMRHRRCQIARFNCDGLNLRLPRCMLWPSVSLSSLPVARLSLGDWTCVSVPSVPCAPFNDNGIRHGGRGESRVRSHCSMGLRSGVRSPVFIVRRMSRKSCLVTVEGQRRANSGSRTYCRGLEPTRLRGSLDNAMKNASVKASVRRKRISHPLHSQPSPVRIIRKRGSASASPSFFG